MSFTERTELMIGSEGVERMSRASVIVFGIGGVGGYAAEAIVRSGIGGIALVDFDTVAESNLNRQIIATENTVSLKKTEAAKQRFLSINPKLEIETYDVFFDENSDIDLSKYDYIIDAIDNISSKVVLAKRASELGVPIISCLSAGNKLDALGFRTGDIFSTRVCPLARSMRRRLKEVGVERLEVVWSEEQPKKPLSESASGRIGSLAYVTGTAGLIAAGVVIKNIAFGRTDENRTQL